MAVGAIGASYLAGNYAADRAVRYIRDLNAAEQAVVEGENAIVAVGNLRFLAPVERQVQVALNRGLNSASASIARAANRVGLEGQNLGEIGQSASVLLSKAAWASKVYIGLQSVAAIASVVGLLIDIFVTGRLPLRRLRRQLRMC